MTSSCAGMKPAQAEDCTGPCVTYALDYEAFANILNSGDGWYYDFYPNLKTAVSQQTGVDLVLNADVVIEPMKDPEPEQRRSRLVSHMITIELQTSPQTRSRCR